MCIMVQKTTERERNQWAHSLLWYSSLWHSAITTIIFVSIYLAWKLEPHPQLVSALGLSCTTKADRIRSDS